MQGSGGHGQPPPVVHSPPGLRRAGWEEDVDPPTKESVAAWERSLRPGQYFSERGGHRPMRHKTQAVQGHPGARAWPRGPDGGAWGPQHLSPIPSEKGYMPLVPSPTTSPGRRSRTGGRDATFPGEGCPTDVAEAFAVAEAVAAEVGFEGLEREALRPFEPIVLQNEQLPPAPPAPPLGLPWRAPPPGFDARTLRRQASALRGEAAAAHRDEEAVRCSTLRLAGILRETIENGKENAALARERLCCLHAALRRLREERVRQGVAVNAAVTWQESLEELREKLESSEERRRRAERAKSDVQRALRAAVDTNGAAEAEVIPLERALEAAWRRDEVAEEMERQKRFQVFVEACRRSQGMRRLAAARHERAGAERREVLREALAAWAVGAALERGGREARQRRAVEAARLCLARWRLFAALERRFRAERRRRSCKRVMDAWRSAVTEAWRDRDLDRRREALVLRRCFRGWRVLRARSILTPQEYVERRHTADRHRLGRLFDRWHLAALASSASSTAIVTVVRRRRDVDTLAHSFRAWASLSRARHWRRRRALRRGLEALASFTGREDGVAGASQMFSNSPWRRRRTGFEGEVRRGSTAALSVELSPAHWGGGRGRRCVGAGGLKAHDLEAVASAHRRRAALSRGFLALLCQGSRQLRVGRGRLFSVLGGGGKGGVVVSVRAARIGFLTWCGAARARGRAREGMEAAEVVWRRKGLAGAVKGLKRFAVVAARQRRADRTNVLKRSFVALRQGCAISRRQKSACCALQNALVSRRLGLLGSAMARLAATGSSGPAAIAAAMAAAPAARRRREREALGAAWRWWVGGWLRRQAEGIRTREVEARRRAKRERDLAEQLEQVQQESAALQKEALAVESELQRTKILVLEQEEALEASRRSLAEASAAATAVKSRLGPAARFDTVHAAKTTKDGRQGTRRPARQTAAARVLVSAEARQRAAAAKAAERREWAAAEARGKLRGQEEADEAALEGALEAARRYGEAVERGQARVEDAEADRRRMQESAAKLLERVDELTRKAEEEAMKGAREASSAESERAALSLAASTAEARAREMMVILDEREREAAKLRRALAAKDAKLKEKRLLRRRATAPVEAMEVSPSHREGTAPLLTGAGNVAATDAPLAACDVHELKESIALLQKKVESSRNGTS
ncbi:hypothetical protein Esi_0016_0144 [Ectocarpus siliculosus]|uniref:Sfi1 spindle body domain-containing protein n=1 Tax=Ectocarpus siliculosus TaxID=2880 RepID=D7FLL9_ECTSI|nr:hypothetical protein Esi_0016_0144 [Ectocarpus siliculosus]|eukprot:CBJ25835.1 hypothetical protein Esi_0016_0144 [Ectocarpus siliculosus]